jgi:putative NADH-flavin reductase
MRAARAPLSLFNGETAVERRLWDTTDDDDARLREVLGSLGVPEDYGVAVRGHRAALDTVRLSNRRWTYASPLADIHAGERTGRFHVGGDELLVDADGRSRISYEDCAVPIVDEIGSPRHIQRRFTVGY